MKESASRRKFLRNSTALLGMTQTVLRSAPADRVNLAFIGLGMRGMHTLLPAFNGMPDTNLVAAVDLYDGRLERAKEMTDGKIWTGKHYQDVLDRKDIDAVVIATPDHWHSRMVLDALSAGKDIYCEKPLTWAIEEGQTLQKAMKGSRQILQVGSQHKTSALTAKAKEIVQSGALGRINMVRSFQHRNNAEGAWVYPIPPDASPTTIDWNSFLGSAPKIAWSPERFFRWRCWWEYSGGVATDLFVHTLTTLHEVLDLKLPKSAVSNGGIYRWKDGRTVPDLLNTVYEYPNGIIVDLCVNLCYSGPGNTLRGTQVIGSEATMYLGGGGGAATIEIHPEPPSKDGAQAIPVASWPTKMREAYFAANGATPDGKPINPPAPPKERQLVRVDDKALPSHQAYFIKSVKDRSPSVEDVSDGHYAAAAAHMANRAYRDRPKYSYELKPV